MFETRTLAVTLSGLDTLLVLEDGAGLAVDDVLEIEGERMAIVQVVTANSFEVLRLAPPVVPHVMGVSVYQLPNPDNNAQLNTQFIDPLHRGWMQVKGVWVHGI